MWSNGRWGQTLAVAFLCARLTLGEPWTAERKLEARYEGL
jgi:hypothetical protein